MPPASLEDWNRLLPLLSFLPRSKSSSNFRSAGIYQTHNSHMQYPDCVEMNYHI